MLFSFSSSVCTTPSCHFCVKPRQTRQETDHTSTDALSRLQTGQILIRDRDYLSQINLLDYPEVWPILTIRQDSQAIYPTLNTQRSWWSEPKKKTNEMKWNWNWNWCGYSLHMLGRRGDIESYRIVSYAVERGIEWVESIQFEMWQKREIDWNLWWWCVRRQIVTSAEENEVIKSPCAIVDPWFFENDARYWRRGNETGY